MHRFYVPDLVIKNRLTSLSDEKLVHQMKHVLRMRTGETVTLFNGMDDNEHLMEIVAIEPRNIELCLRETTVNHLEPKRVIHLYQAIPKKADLFDLILQKGTEMGVSHFYPLITERTENRRLMKLERRETIVKEASEQCGRSRIPKIHSPVGFADAIAKAPQPYLAYEFADKQGLLDWWPMIEKQNEMSLFIGPEGGFGNDEIALAREHHVKIFSLGKRILRVETASLASMALLLLSHLE